MGRKRSRQTHGASSLEREEEKDGRVDGRDGCRGNVCVCVCLCVCVCVCVSVYIIHFHIFILCMYMCLHVSKVCFCLAASQAGRQTVKLHTAHPAGLQPSTTQGSLALGLSVGDAVAVLGSDTVWGNLQTRHTPLVLTWGKLMLARRLLCSSRKQTQSS